MRLRMAELSKLPQEMKFQILSRLPPKSLMRFKCVHKSWHAVINSPNFAAKHVSVSKHNKLSCSTTILVKRYVIDLNTDKTEMVLSLFDLCHEFKYDNDDDHHLHHSIMEDLHVPPSMGLKKRDRWTGIEGVEMAGHCDGIICLTDHRKTVVLCNPAIKEFNRLPLSSLVISCADLRPDGSAIAAVGFGCDLQSKNYKVVRILHSRCENNDMRVVRHPPKAEVFSLITRTWKEIKTDNIDNETTNVWPDSTVYVYLKGTLYWRGYEENKEFDASSSYTYEDNDSEDKQRIIAFDVGDETFHVISFPSGYYFHDKVFGLWNESIAVCTCWSIPDQDPCLDILVLDNSVEGSWTSYLTVEPIVNIEFPLALVGKNEQFLLVSLDDCVLILYDISARKFKYLPIKGDFLYRTQALFYVNSVVSIKGDTDCSHIASNLVDEV